MFFALKGDSDKVVGRVITLWEEIQKRSHKAMYKEIRKDVNSDNFCYRKFGRTITKWEAKEKSPILL